MKYVFDTNTLIVIFTYYYEDRFPTFWQGFNRLISNGEIGFVREQYQEIAQFVGESRLTAWANENKKLFTNPSREETEFIAQIFRVNHFQGLVEKKRILEGKPDADPFIIAKAKIEAASVVTQEKLKAHASKIPNVCDYFHIPYTDLEGFMTREGWSF